MARTQRAPPPSSARLGQINFGDTADRMIIIREAVAEMRAEGKDWTINVPSSILQKLRLIECAATSSFESQQTGIMAAFYYKQRPQSSQALSIPDITARILLNLSPVDLASANGISRDMRYALQSCPGLLQKQHLLAYPTSHFETLWDEFLIDTTQSFSTRAPAAHDFEFMMEFSRSQQDALAKIKLARPMMISQPTPTRLEVYINCCKDINHDPEAHRIHIPAITLATGVTINQVQAVVSRLKAEHTLCPHADATLHREDGSVETVITLRAVVRLQPDDPITEKRAAVLAKRGDARAFHQSDECARYIQAKQTALANGHPIPTLAEFREAERDPWEVREAL